MPKLNGKSSAGHMNSTLLVSGDEAADHAQEILAQLCHGHLAMLGSWLGGELLPINGPHGAPRGALRTFGGPSTGRCGGSRASLGPQYHPSVVPSGLYGAREGPRGVNRKFQPRGPFFGGSLLYMRASGADNRRPHVRPWHQGLFPVRCTRLRGQQPGCSAPGRVRGGVSAHTYVRVIFYQPVW